MKIIGTKRLTGPQEEQLVRLTRLCRAAESLTLSCPLDGDMFWLLYEESELLAALAVYIQENVWECYAFTRPDRRRQGCFSQLLERLEAEAEKMDEEPEICFITDGNSAGTLKTLEAVGAEFWYEEHAMVWEMAAQGAEAHNTASLPLTDRTVRLEMSADSSQPSLYLCTARASAGTQVGAFSLYIQDSSACLYQLEVPQPLRGQGWGTAVVCALLDKLPAMGISRLVLQVSGGNAPAISLYQKTGFRITETLSYYLY